jgi:molybdenum cofactor guanylyltransferase
MGRDKATLEIDGETLAMRAAGALTAVAYPVLVVGPAAGTQLHSVDDPREGPLMALVVGGAALRAWAHAGPFLFVACDLPNITAEALREVSEALGEADVALPVVDGFDQPLAACYSQHAIDVAARAAAREVRSMREFVMTLNVKRVDMSVRAQEFADVDTPEEWKRIRGGPA